MRTKLLFAAGAVATAAVVGPLPQASAVCDLNFFLHTGYCSPCLLVADHSQRPEPIFCPL